MDLLAIKLYLLVLCIAWQAEGQRNNKEDDSIKNRDKHLDTEFRKLQDDITEIRSLIKKFFIHLDGEEGKAKYEEWYEENRNDLNDKKRRILAAKDKLGSVESYRKTTEEEIKKLQDLNDLAKSSPQDSSIPQPKSGALRRDVVGEPLQRDALDERLRALGQRVALMRAEALSQRAELRAASDAHDLADNRFAQTQAVLQGEHSANGRRAEEKAALDSRLQEADGLFASIKNQADELLELKTKFQEQVATLAARRNDTEAKIRTMVLEIEKLKTSSISSTIQPTGLNYVKSVKTASGRGKKIRLVLVSD